MDLAQLHQIQTKYNPQVLLLLARKHHSFLYFHHHKQLKLLISYQYNLLLILFEFCDIILWRFEKAVTKQYVFCAGSSAG